MRWLCRLGLALLASLMGPWAMAKGVLIISASPAQPGRFVALERSAEKLGLPLRSRFVEKIPGAELGPALWQGADLVLIDAPRQHIEDFVRAKLGDALPALSQVPHLWLPTSAARAGGGLDHSLAQRLHAYFVQGGPANTEALLLTLKALLQGQDWRPFAPPFVYPSVGLYHPNLPQGVVGTAKDYWRARQLTDRPGRPVIGIAFHQGSLASGQTAVLDDLIERIEAQGAIALPFYSPVMEADAMHRALSRDGKLVADVLINTQITLNPEGRRKEFEAMGIPVVQAMPWRKGSAAQWQANPHGIPLMDVPFYLAQAEYAGITDIQIAMATEPGDEQLRSIPAQSAAVVAKALNLARLRHTPAQDKRVAIFFWNYPAGEKNLSASFMNLPRSLEEVLQNMAAAGYRTQALPETELLPKLQALLAPGYRPAGDQQVLRQLLRDGLADRLPVRQYEAWLASLPPHIGQALRERWGPADHSSMVLRDESAGREEAAFVIPRLQLGAVTLLPQPGRGERGGDKEKALYHSTLALPTHHYLATYLWARQSAAVHALVHFGTHGTQEWLPGKERGLSVHDWPLLAVGDTPVFYPYIVDNIGEATQAKRRGRAVILSHQTPPLTPAGLHDRLTQIHDLLHQWLSQDEGEVRQQIRKDFLARVHAERIALDIGWTIARIDADFEGFVSAVHDHLHELALTAQPFGLHTFGRGSGETQRIAQVLMMLGPDFWEGVADPQNPAEEVDELLITDYKRLPDTKPYRLLAAYLREGQAINPLTPAAQKRLAFAHTWYEALGAKEETQALLEALEGRHIPTSYGGDPLKNPDALPTGRNLYGFDPSRVPSKAAWDAGKLAFDQLLATHRKETGRALSKASFTLWSVETMRHFGLLEAQALWALGVEPVWDSGGRVHGVRLIPRSQLGRPRVDVVLSATGLYRDHFPNVMKQLASAAQLASEAQDEADNPVAANAQRIQHNLMAAGLSASQARNLGATRIFSSASGRYGSGLDDAALATDTWRTQAEGDRKLAELYLSRMQFAYGPDEAQWETSGAPGLPHLNLYAEHLRGTQAAVLSRSSNLYGMLTTDDPFQYLGGMSLAVRHLDGQAPALYISNLRGAGAGRMEGAATFLAKELAIRNFHPGHIEGLMAEGYAGTLQVLEGLNNFAGWQSVAREIVRHDQWQEFMDVYVRDKHQLGLREWFEQHNPHALAQSMERMLEAARLQQWEADSDSVAELRLRYRELARRFQVRSDNAVFERFVGTGLGERAAAATKGLSRSRPSVAPTTLTQPPQAAGPPTAPQVVPQPKPIRGLKLERVAAPSPERSDPLSLALSVLALLLCSGGGAARGWRWRAGALRPSATAA